MGSRAAIELGCPRRYELTDSDVLAGTLLSEPDTLGEDKTKSAYAGTPISSSTPSSSISSLTRMPPFMSLFWILKKTKAMPPMTMTIVRAPTIWAPSWPQPVPP